MKKSKAEIRQVAALGTNALKRGDLDLAQRLLSEAAQASPRDPAILLNLGLVNDRLGETDEAARLLCEAAALSPREPAFARSFSAFAARSVLSRPGELNPAGLKAVLSVDTLDRQPVVEVAIAHVMAQPELAAALDQVRGSAAEAAARELLLPRTSAPLADGLLLKALGAGKNADPETEALLAALRRAILLDLPPDRLREDRSLFAFALALVHQCFHNDHVWAESEEETRALAALQMDIESLRAGDVAEALTLTRLLLYRDLGAAGLAGVAARDLSRVRPKLLGELLVEQAGAREADAQHGEEISRIGAIDDPVSQRVAGQYEKSPYPRWSSLPAIRPGGLKTALSRMMGPDKVAFMDAPFNVLIAGCGTGHQAALAASGYGPNARLTAIDISRASLAYAKSMCERLGIGTIDFMQADIRDAALLERQFDIVECVGVLHHMAEPYEGWRTLVARLRPGGLMYVGLYSALSRANIAALRGEPEWPGPGCSDGDARAYRALLMARQQGEPGSELKDSGDFYSLNEFRDLVLHESEQHMTLEEIADFMSDAGLAFRGFTIEQPAMARFAERFPDDTPPGSLANWAELERENPRLFDAMYRFWCEKTA